MHRHRFNELNDSLTTFVDHIKKKSDIHLLNGYKDALKNYQSKQYDVLENSEIWGTSD